MMLLDFLDDGLTLKDDFASLYLNFAFDNAQGLVSATKKVTEKVLKQSHIWRFKVMVVL